MARNAYVTGKIAESKIPSISNDLNIETVSVLIEAERLINGQRRQDYGGALESFTRIADLWTPVLGMTVTPEQVALCMVQLKVARWVNGQQHDSLVDAAGYIGLIEIMGNERSASQ